ncbi:hypothetical protein MTsDn1_21480 [Alteromonas sp. MTD1]
MYTRKKQAFVLTLLMTLWFCNAFASENAYVHHPLAVYSTYPSGTLKARCEAEGSQTLCKEDAVSIEDFVSSLEKSELFKSLAPFGQGTDYELLIANIGNPLTGEQFAEFTLQWRGLEINTISTTCCETLLTHQRTAEELVNVWINEIVNRKLFSSAFLFSAIQASDYAQLLVPEHIGEFTKLDTQLYADPFSGAITRYTHAQFEDALVDVTVYPFMDTLSAKESELLREQLDDDLERASRVAMSQSLTLSQPAPAAPYSADNDIQGWRLSLKAESETAPTIYATTYVFKRGDKIVKVATTFPAQFSDSIANELITAIHVPDESILMKNIRQLLINSKSGG